MSFRAKLREYNTRKAYFTALLVSVVIILWLLIFLQKQSQNDLEFFIQFEDSSNSSSRDSGPRLKLNDQKSEPKEINSLKSSTHTDRVAVNSTFSASSVVFKPMNVELFHPKSNEMLQRRQNIDNQTTFRRDKIKNV